MKTRKVSVYGEMRKQVRASFKALIADAHRKGYEQGLRAALSITRTKKS